MRSSTHRVLLPAAAALTFGSLAWAFTVTPTNIAETLGDEELATSEICVDVPADAVVPKVDVYLLADTTGSMGSIITTLKTGASTVVGDLYDDLGADGIDVRIGVGNYKDFPHDLYAFDHQIDLADEADEADVLAGIAGWSANGGRDGSEGQFFALDRLAKDIDPAGGDIGWRSDAKKIIVWFGDAPAHDPVCSAISGLADDITEASVTDALTDDDFTVIAISTTGGFANGLDDNPQSSAGDYLGDCGVIGGAAGQGTRIADATGGSYSTGVNATTIVETILDEVDDSAGTIASLGLDVSDALQPYVLMTSPPQTNVDTSSASKHCFDVDWRGICEDDEKTVWGTIDVVADGATVGSVSVDLTLESCCPTDGDLGAAAPYNVFVMGWFNGSNSDIEGRIAIGEDATFESYGIGSKTGSGITLSVGDDLTVTNSQIYGGDGEVGGSCTTSSTGVPNGTLTCNHAGTFDAGDFMSDMVALSDHMADYAPNGTTSTTTWGSVTLTGSDPDLNIFELDLDNLGFASWVWNGWINTFSIDVPDGSTVIVNVLNGTDPLFKNGGFNLTGTSAYKIVWNFNSQKSLGVKNVTVPGSILLPHGTLTFNNANIDGTVIAWDAQGSGEYHNRPFDGNICL